MNGLAFVALVSVLLGMLLTFSAVNNMTIQDYAKQVLKL